MAHPAWYQKRPAGSAERTYLTYVLTLTVILAALGGIVWMFRP